MIIAHRVQLITKPYHEQFFAQACGIARHTWNWALAEWDRQKNEPDSANKKINSLELKKQFLAQIDEQWPWMRVVPNHVYHQPFNDLSVAWRRCYKGLAEEPVAKHKGQSRDSFYLANTCFKITGRALTISKLGAVRMREDLRFSGRIMSARISRDADKWFISVTIEQPDSGQVVHKAPETVVGVDLGIAQMAALSTGEMYANPRAASCYEKKLKGLQRKFSRQMVQLRVRNGFDPIEPLPRGTRLDISQRMKKTKRRIQRVHQEITGLRNNAQHQMTAEITKQFGVIVIEDLKVKDMTAGAKGKQKIKRETKRAKKKPKWYVAKAKTGQVARRVAQKSGLNRAILDVGFGEIRRQLEYKAQRTGSVVIPVDPRYTSQTCGICGSVSAENRKTQAQFVCKSCGYTANADSNAARNIKTAGLAKKSEGIVAKEIKRVGKVNPTRKKNSAVAESTADAAGYARGETSHEDRSVNRERERETVLLSGILTDTHSPVFPGEVLTQAVLSF